jgi:hypothetical protein
MKRYLYLILIMSNLKAVYVIINYLLIELKLTLHYLTKAFLMLGVPVGHVIIGLVRLKMLT